MQIHIFMMKLSFYPKLDMFLKIFTQKCPNTFVTPFSFGVCETLASLFFAGARRKSCLELASLRFLGFFAYLIHSDTYMLSMVHVYSVQRCMFVRTHLTRLSHPSNVEMGRERMIFYRHIFGTGVCE